MGALETLKDNILGTKEQNEIAQKNLDKQASEGGKLAKLLGGNPEPKESKDSAKKMAKGGSASSRADGIAIRGKTRA